jgi:hypothetical protein
VFNHFVTLFSVKIFISESLSIFIRDMFQKDFIEELFESLMKVLANLILNILLFDQPGNDLHELMPDNASLGIPVVDGLLGCDCCPFESDVFGFQIVAFQFQLFYHSGERDGRYAPGRADWENARIVFIVGY